MHFIIRIWFGPDWKAFYAVPQGMKSKKRIEQLSIGDEERPWLLEIKRSMMLADYSAGNNRPVMHITQPARPAKPPAHRQSKCDHTCCGQCWCAGGSAECDEDGILGREGGGRFSYLAALGRAEK